MARAPVLDDAAPPPEADRIEGAPHPRVTRRLFGQARAEDAFLQAARAGRLHHAWLLTGPRGVGKATLAWRIARALLTDTAPDDGLFGAPEPQGLALRDPGDDPLSRRLAQLAEPRLHLTRRPWDDKAGRHRQDITVDEIRKLKSFFQMTAADGGRRVAIVDAADDLNTPAANALLKLLEEPPPGAVLLLIAHQPAGLLPTIRSRCRTLRLAALAPDDIAQALADAGADADVAARHALPLAALSGGSVGEAMRLINLDGLASYGALIDLAASLPRLDRAAALSFAESHAQRGAEARLALAHDLIDLMLARLARCGLGLPPDPAATPDEAAILTRLCPDATAARIWAEAQIRIGARLRHGRAVNLDAASALLDAFLDMAATAGSLPA
ncbi:DNA polymerase III subunit delta' [Paracoccus sp. p4-l81]|uniref:DNA polymerase III subunit delta' n=1 Tax=unclassified Paracoccus (in: a-proteobacteria) TaxID=2688777 RepID=UPI0035B83C59